VKRSSDEPSGKTPGFYLYVGDLERELQKLSVPAQALWTRMLLKMHEAPRRGFMEHSSGAVFTNEELARLLGVTVKNVVKLLDEMRHVGTFSHDDSGVIFSRRMVRDTELSETRRRAGMARSPLVSAGKFAEQNGSKAPPNEEHNLEFAEPESSRVRAGAPARAHSEIEIEEDPEVERIKESTKTSLIDDFEKFCLVASKAGMSMAPGDIVSARFEWQRLDFEQRLAAVRDVPKRVSSGEYLDPKYIPLPGTYLKGRYWFRPQKPARAQQTKQDQAIEVFHDLMEDRIAKSRPTVQSKRLA